MAVPGGSVVKNPSAIKETQERQVRSLGSEDPMDKAMATHNLILDWKIPGTEEPGGLQLMGSYGSHGSDMTEAT